jgi:hypothetical protein
MKAFPQIQLPTRIILVPVVSPNTGLQPETLAQDRHTDVLHMVAQRTVTDLCTLAAAPLPADELQLLLLGIARELKDRLLLVDHAAELHQ